MTSARLPFPPSPRARTAALALVVALAGCTQFPDLDETETPGVADAPYPRLVPLDSLLEAPEPLAQPEMLEDLDARVADLQGRAGQLQGITPLPAAQNDDVSDRLARLRQKADALRAAQ